MQQQQQQQKTKEIKIKIQKMNGAHLGDCCCAINK